MLRLAWVSFVFGCPQDVGDAHDAFSDLNVDIGCLRSCGIAAMLDYIVGALRGVVLGVSMCATRKSGLRRKEGFLPLLPIRPAAAMGLYIGFNQMYWR
jgi:hypothetical protein